MVRLGNVTERADDWKQPSYTRRQTPYGNPFQGAGASFELLTCMRVSVPFLRKALRPTTTRTTRRGRWSPSTAPPNGPTVAYHWQHVADRHAAAISRLRGCPRFGQQLRLLQHRLRCPLLHVRRVPVLAQDALHIDAQLC